MNGRTAKIVRRYAQAKNIHDRVVKREWYSLNHKQRGKKRKEMRRLAYPD